MGHSPYTFLICNEHKSVSVGETIGGLEVVSIAFNEVGLAVTILIPQEREISGLLLCNNDIVVGQDEQSARVLQACDKRRNCEALHDSRRLSCVWDEQRSACRNWIGFWRR